MHSERDVANTTGTPLCGSILRFTGTPTHIPIPTLYLTENQQKPKLSIIEMVLYNIASMMAGVASGFDIRVTNVSPIHPNLQPNMQFGDPFPNQFVLNDVDREVVLTDLTGQYKSNTYYGPVRHAR
jgi:mitogen-activated protein kinase kinase kinase 9